MTIQFAAAIAVLLSVGCAHTQYADTADSALGRVVVYRNGIAYYERRAQVSENRLTLRVAQNKVDDFLRSLTVMDQETGEALPISFPTQSAGEDGMVDMVVQLPPGRSSGELRLSYITESPAWKPSYRLMVREDGRVEVQGWAIVDNMSGEDWNDVQLAVGASSALSFRFDLRSIRAVHRETLALSEDFARPPPTGGASHQELRAQAATDGATLSIAESELPGGYGGLDSAFDVDEVAASSGAGSMPQAARQPRARPAPPASPVLNGLVDRLNGSGEEVVIRGFASTADRDPESGALMRANRLRNHLIEQGVAPAQLVVEAGDVRGGENPGVDVVTQQATETAAGTEGSTQPIGESHFESEARLSVDHGTSAMVSVLSEDTEGEVVYFFDPLSERGDQRFAYKAVRFQNPTDSTLEAGPATVFGSGRFIGEGLTESIPAGSFAFIPYALDRQVRVERVEEQDDEISDILHVERGVVTAQFRHVKTTTLTVRNRLHHEATVYARHRIPAGWDLESAPENRERIGDDYVFRLDLPAGTVETFTIVQHTPLERTIDLRSASARRILGLYLARDNVESQLEEPMRALLALRGQADDFQRSITTKRRQIADYRQRSNELHAQILTLEVVRDDESPLLQHLRQRMAEISDRLQAATIALVDLEQRLLTTRIRFDSDLAELTVMSESGTSLSPNEAVNAAGPTPTGPSQPG